MTTAPVVLPAKLPPQLKNVAIGEDANGSDVYTTGGDMYTILFLTQTPESTLQSYVHAYTVATLTATRTGASPPSPDNPYITTTARGTVALPDGTKANLSLEQGPSGSNIGTLSVGTFEKADWTYTLNLSTGGNYPPDLTEQVLSTMVPVSSNARTESPEQQFISAYYAAVSRQDWRTTYSLLDSASKAEFTENEWVTAQQARQAANNSLPVESATIANLNGEGAGFVAKVILTYQDGSQETLNNITVSFENGVFRRRLTAEEIKFLKDIGAVGSGSNSSASEKASVESTIRDHYGAIGMGDFQSAYSYFGPTFRSEESKETWVRNEQSYGITSSTINSLQVTGVNGNTATASVNVSFTDNTGSPRFLITWSFVKEDGQWKLDDQLSAKKIS